MFQKFEKQIQTLENVLNCHYQNIDDLNSEYEQTKEKYQKLLNLNKVYLLYKKRKKEKINLEDYLKNLERKIENEDYFAKITKQEINQKIDLWLFNNRDNYKILKKCKKATYEMLITIKDIKNEMNNPNIKLNDVFSTYQAGWNNYKLFIAFQNKTDLLNKEYFDKIKLEPQNILTYNYKQSLKKMKNFVKNVEKEIKVKNNLFSKMINEEIKKFKKEILTNT